MKKLFISSLILLSGVASAQNVGIGTLTPNANALLHVSLGSSATKGLLVTGAHQSFFSSVPDLGAGSRMMFYPGKAAFRAGNVTGTHWDDANVGIFSSAIGANTTARGNYSTAMGYGPIAGGYASTAMGFNTTAGGNYSTSMGFNTTAKGYASTVIGMYNDPILLTDETAVNPTTSPLFIIGNGDAGALRNAMVVQKNGNVGIGTTSSPSAKLQVNGTLKVTDGSQGTGKVLTSDANGLATWALPVGLTLPYSGTVSSSQTLFALSNDAGHSISGYSPGAGTIGVQGTTSAGMGIYGGANAGTGVNAYSNTGNAGVFQSQAGLAIKTLGGDVEINGKIKIADGTQGVNKVFTSDATGTGSWVSPSPFSVRKLNGNQTIPISNGFATIVDFGNNVSQSGTAYNSATSEYTAPSTGFYQFNVSLTFTQGAAGTGNSIFIQMYKNSNFFYVYQFIHATIMGSKGFSPMVFLNEGDIIDVRILNNSGVSIDIIGLGSFIYSSFSGFRVN